MFLQRPLLAGQGEQERVDQLDGRRAELQAGGHGIERGPERVEVRDQERPVLRPRDERHLGRGREGQRPLGADQQGDSECRRFDGSQSARLYPLTRRTIFGNRRLDLVAVLDRGPARLCGTPRPQRSREPVLRSQSIAVRSRNSAARAVGQDRAESDRTWSAVLP